MTSSTFQESVALRVATADQQHTMRRMRTELGQPHPWYQSLAMDVVRRVADRTASLCPHLGPRAGVRPMYALYTPGPMAIECKACMVARRRRFSPVDEATCDRCSVYTRDGVYGAAIPVGPLLIIFGVCEPCSTELGMPRPAGEMAAGGEAVA